MAGFFTMYFNDGFVLLYLAPSKQPRESTSGNTYYRTIHEGKDVLKLMHTLSSVVLSCRHDLAKVHIGLIFTCLYPLSNIYMPVCIYLFICVIGIDSVHTL